MKILLLALLAGAIAAAQCTTAKPCYLVITSGTGTGGVGTSFTTLLPGTFSGGTLTVGGGSNLTYTSGGIIDSNSLMGTQLFGLTGLLKMTGTGVIGATPGTDYMLPSSNAATATALAATPSLCPAGLYPLGVSANGNAASCTNPFAALTGLVTTAAGVMTAAPVTGDGTMSPTNLLTNTRINGTSVPASPAADRVLGTTGTSVGTWLIMPSCAGGTQKLLYDTATHQFTCGVDATGGGGGGGGSGLVSVTDAGIVNAYAASPVGCTAPADGTLIALHTANASTSATPTLNYCGSGVVQIQYRGGAGLAVGAIMATGSPVASNLIVFRATKWELMNTPRAATSGPSGEAAIGIDDTGNLVVTPKGVADAISNLSPWANQFNIPFQHPRLNASSNPVMAWSPGDPGSGRILRAAVPDGLNLTTVAGYANRGLPLTLSTIGAGCNVTGSGVSATQGQGITITSASTASGNECRLTAGTGLNWAGTSIFFDTSQKLSTTTLTNYLFGYGVDSATLYDAATTTILTYPTVLVAFRFSATAGDTTYKCLVSNGGANVDLIDSGVVPDTTSPTQFTILTDDAGTRVRWWIRNTEVCTGATWHLPGGVAVGPQIGYKQSAIGGPAALTGTYVAMEASR